MKAESQLGILILAAGGSTRLGQPKQMLTYQSKYLLEHCLDTFSALNVSICVVLGAYHEEIRKEIDLSGYDVAINKDWPLGIGSSLRLGVNRIMKNSNINHLLITLSDLPLITTEDYRSFIMYHLNTNSAMTFSEYDQTIGVPAIFSKQYFSDLIDLNNKQGAKALRIKYSNLVQTFEMYNAKFDIDTKHDYEKLLEL